MALPLKIGEQMREAPDMIGCLVGNPPKKIREIGDRIRDLAVWISVYGH
jgi:hypothetical protein